MIGVLSDSSLAVFFSLGLAGPLLGATRWANWPRVGRAIAIALGIWSFSALLLKQPIHVWAPPAALAAADLIATVLQRHRTTVTRLFGSSRLQAAPFFVVGPLLVCAWASYLDFQVPIAELPTESKITALSAPVPVPTVKSALTDRGNAIRLYSQPPLSKTELSKSEIGIKRIYSLAMIRTSDPDPVTNCHGWIFTNGQYWLRNDEVDQILKDNGYEKVERTRAGDLVIYRDSSGHVQHSALVRLVNDADVFVESKWGASGRYMHRVADQSYSLSWIYFRSQRQGHALQLRDDGPDGTGPMLEN